MKGGMYGTVLVDGVLVCESVENVKFAIPDGEYSASLRWSGKFNRLVPHLQVPGRTYIEIHPTLGSDRLRGCIGVGRADFDDLMTLLPAKFLVRIVSA